MHYLNQNNLIGWTHHFVNLTNVYAQRLHTIQLFIIFVNTSKLIKRQLHLKCNHNCAKCEQVVVNKIKSDLDWSCVIEFRCNHFKWLIKKVIATSEKSLSSILSLFVYTEWTLDSYSLLVNVNRKSMISNLNSELLLKVI